MSELVVDPTTQEIAARFPRVINCREFAGEGRP